MRNRLLLTASLLAFSGIVFVSCSKEKMPAPSNAKQTSVTANSKSDTPSSSSSQEGSSSSDYSTSTGGGCSHGG